MPLTPFIAFANVEHDRRFAVIFKQFVDLLRANLGNFFARFGHDLLKTFGHDFLLVDLMSLS